MEQYKFFLRDLVSLLKEKLKESKQREVSNPNDDFEKGLVMGFYESLDLIKYQANIFEIPMDEIGLDNYNLEEYL
ncbi:MAG: hypothetical protein WC756_18060 [Taibaiella sp.]